MKYMTDAHLSGLSKELKRKGIDCETVHQRMMGHEDSLIAVAIGSAGTVLLRKKRARPKMDISPEPQ